MPIRLSNKSKNIKNLLNIDLFENYPLRIRILKQIFYNS
jgi:hypothetical protein